MLKRQAPLKLLLALPVFLSGCFVIRQPCVPDKDLEHYRTLAMAPLPTDPAESAPGHAPLFTEPPLVVDDSAPPPTWDLTLDEAMRMALENARVLRDLGGSVLRAPAVAQTLNDPAIQASDPRFGMEGALAAYDAHLNTRVDAQHNDRAFNNLFLGGGTFLFQQDLDTFDTELTKTTATGTQFAVRHHVDYDDNNAPANLFRSSWNTNYETEVRQPLLQGGGLDFNRIAGPNGTPWLMTGIVLARINNDVSTAEFEIGVRDFISNLENAYWDLYYAYRDLDAKIAARDTSLKTWRLIQANVQEGRGYSKLQEVQALEQYYRFQEEVVDSLGGRLVERTRTNNGTNGGTFRGIGGVYAAERRLRLWMGQPISDGRLIRPIDEPPQAKVIFDWGKVTQEALAMRPELHRQRSQVQRASMELVAAKNFLLPRLDALGRYRWRGFGRDWMGPADPNMPYNNALANLTSGQFQEWEMGLQYSMTLGFRREHATVRNAQLRVSRERAVLEEQERQTIHDLADAFGDVPRAFGLMQVAHNRLDAAQDQFRRANDAFFELGGKVSLELVLDARIRLAEAETDYHRARIDYAVALKNVHFEKGSLLEYNGTVLADRALSRSPLGAFAHKADNTDESRLNYAMARPPRAGQNSRIENQGAAAIDAPPARDSQAANRSPTPPAEPATIVLTSAQSSVQPPASEAIPGPASSPTNQPPAAEPAILPPMDTVPHILPPGTPGAQHEPPPNWKPLDLTIEEISAGDTPTPIAPPASAGAITGA
ncbi:MAG TPA: TolC family protein [Pirellulales bacterium]|nr:TolC family protein [Pirellulales bacterium]